MPNLWDTGKIFNAPSTSPNVQQEPMSRPPLNLLQEQAAGLTVATDKKLVGIVAPDPEDGNRFYLSANSEYLHSPPVKLISLICTSPSGYPCSVEIVAEEEGEPEADWDWQEEDDTTCRAQTEAELLQSLAQLVTHPVVCSVVAHLCSIVTVNQANEKSEQKRLLDYEKAIQAKFKRISDLIEQQKKLQLWHETKDGLLQAEQEQMEEDFSAATDALVAAADLLEQEKKTLEAVKTNPLELFPADEEDEIVEEEYYGEPEPEEETYQSDDDDDWDDPFGGDDEEWEKKKAEQQARAEVLALLNKKMMEKQLADDMVAKKAKPLSMNDLKKQAYKKVDEDEKLDW